MLDHVIRNKARKLTATAIARTKPPSHGQRDIPDTDPRGFGLRVSATGVKSFTFLFRAKSGPKVGKLQRLTLGRVPSTTDLKDVGQALADAREQARTLRTEVERGGDPKARLDAERRETQWHTGNTVEAVVRQFVEKHCKKKLRSHRIVERALERHVLPKWGTRPITEISRRDVIELLDGIADGGSPIMANRVGAYVSKLFNWSLSRGIIEASPAIRIERPAKEVPRDRCLREVEIRDLWNAFDAQSYPFDSYFKFLLVSAQRRTEVAAMAWSELSDDRRTWTIPGSRTKNGKAHLVALPDQAVAILESLLRHRGDYVFTTSAGRRPISGFGKGKERVDRVVVEARREAAKEAGQDPEMVKGIAHWTLHDLRRSAATGMAELGIPGDHIGRTLGHTIRGVTAVVYDQHSYEPEKRRALAVWANKIDAIVSGASNIEVLRMQKTAKR